MLCIIQLFLIKFNYNKAGIHIVCEVTWMLMLAGRHDAFTLGSLGRLRWHCRRSLDVWCWPVYLQNGSVHGEQKTAWHFSHIACATLFTGKYKHHGLSWLSSVVHILCGNAVTYVLTAAAKFLFSLSTLNMTHRMDAITSGASTLHPSSRRYFALPLWM